MHATIIRATCASAAVQKSFLRDYAATNDHEFFAIAVENFFERPEEFRENHPQLFQVLADLLNQEKIVC